MAEAPTRSDAPTAHARFLQTREFGSLNGLRALAILAVVWHHSMNEGEGRFRLLSRGFLGVDLFFVISGFLIATLLLRERRRSGTIHLRNFYLRRVLRIFPAYYLMLAVVAAIAFLKPGSGTPAIKHELPYALFYLANLFPMKTLLSITWSLSVEEQFYFVVPTLEKISRTYLPLGLFVAYVLCSLPPFGAFPHLPLPDFFRQTTFGPILLGVLLAHALDTPRIYQTFRALLGHRLAPGVALLAALAVSTLTPPDVTGWPRLAIHLMFGLLVAACVVREDHVLRAPFSLWPIQRIGIVSYGIYLYHMLVRHFASQGMARLGSNSEIVRFLLVGLGTWILAEASYRLFEARFLKLKERFAR